MTLTQRILFHVFQNFSAGRGNVITANHYVDQVLRPLIVLSFAHNHSHMFQQEDDLSDTSMLTIDVLRQYNTRNHAAAVISQPRFESE